MKPITTITMPALALALTLLGGCFGAAPEPEAGTAAHDTAAEPSNRVDIPVEVRNNLGITFVAVEPRYIERTLRVPGRFELLPTATREYRTVLPGRIELLVNQYDRVERGRPLYRIVSPAWRELQQQLVELNANVARSETSLETFGPLMAAHEQHEESLRHVTVVWHERLHHLEQVRDAGGGRIDELTAAQSSLATARSDLAALREKDAELRAQRTKTTADIAAAKSRRDFLLTSVASMVGETPAALRETVTHDGEVMPAWAAIDAIEVRAEEAGVVSTVALTNGAWADENTTVLTTVRPELLRFHAQGLQSDLGRFRDGLPARIVPPVPTRSPDGIDLTATMAGTLALGISGDPDDRTIDLYVTPDTLLEWARPGISAHLEIVTDGTAGPALAVPLAAVQRDGLSPVLFRRDPVDPNKAIRIEGDLGLNDGRWVEVRSGLRAGDEVVLDGAFQLMLATSGSAQKGGHFHADGTFHEGED